MESVEGTVLQVDGITTAEVGCDTTKQQKNSSSGTEARVPIGGTISKCNESKVWFVFV